MDLSGELLELLELLELFNCQEECIYTTDKKPKAIIQITNASLIESVVEPESR